MATIALTKKSHPGRRLLRKWFDELEDTLRQEAKSKGLFGHTGMVGTAREFVVRRILGSFLPPSIHVGTGRIIAAQSEASPQVDIVVFDPRFPYLRDESGQALYPIEGVIATIEVKSVLTKDELKKSLDNCMTIASMPVGILTSDLDAEIKRVNWYARGRADIAKWICKAVLPRTYLFAFSGISTIETMSEHVRDWFQQTFSRISEIPALPSMIVTDKCLSLNLTEKIVMVNVDHSFGPTGTGIDPKSVVNLIGHWETSRQFGLMATHILDAIHDREMSQRAGHIRLGYADYFPFNEYFREYLADTRWISLAKLPTGMAISEQPEIGK